MPRKYRPKFRPIFRPILRPGFRLVKKNCRRNFALGNVRRNYWVFPQIRLNVPFPADIFQNPLKKQPFKKRPIGRPWNVEKLRTVHKLPEILEDVNGEKLTVKKWWILGADFSRFTQSFSRFIRDINGEKKTSPY